MQKPHDRTAAHEAKVQRIHALRAEARTIVRAVHEAADGLNPDAVILAGRSLRSILWHLARLGISVQPDDLAPTDGKG